jgi:hypothetical protein
MVVDLEDETGFAEVASKLLAFTEANKPRL